jgi:uncharacterized protein (TIGR03437 family)
VANFRAKTFWIGLLLTVLPGAAQQARARVVNVSINTAGLTSLPPSVSPFFSVVFVLTDGSGVSDGNNRVNISGITLGGGSALGNSVVSGGATGSLKAGVAITDSSFLNYFLESFSPGTQISFTLTLSNADDLNSLPDRFSVYILDGTGTPIPTLATTSGAVFGVDLSSENPGPQTWNADTSRFPAGSPSQALPLFVSAITAVTPAYSSAPVIEPGSWMTIYGSGLADSIYNWNSDFAPTLGGASVKINGKPGYLLYVSPDQINLQAPDDATAGPVDVTLTSAAGNTTSSVTLAAVSPSFAPLGDGVHILAQIATPDGSGAFGDGTYDLAGQTGAFPYATRPVKAGEVVTLWGVGFGPTVQPIAAGQIVTNPASTVQTVTATIGGVNAGVSYSGITLAGLYQLNVTVPVTGTGDQPIVASVSGVSTPRLMLTIQ